MKVHGDYLDTRIKNTAEELDAYDPRIDRLLDQIFDEFGLVIVGWSSDWDPALRAALNRCKTHRFTTYWATRGALSDGARALVTQRRAQEVRIADADRVFSELREKLEALEQLDRPHPLSAEIAVQSLKRYITDGRVIDLHDLVITEVEHVYEQLGPAQFPVQSGTATGPTQERFRARLRKYEALSGTLVSLLANGIYWGGSKHAEIWVKALERIVNPWEEPGGSMLWLTLRYYPALLLLYASGIAAVAANDYAFLLRLLTERIFHDDRNGGSAGEALSAAKVIPNDRGGHWLFDRRYTPASDYLFALIRPTFSSLIPDDVRYARTFGRWEYLYSLHRAHIGVWIPLGQFGWRDTGRDGDPVIAPASEEAVRMGPNWPPLKAGMFGGTIEGFQEAEAKVMKRVRDVGWY